MDSHGQQTTTANSPRGQLEVVIAEDRPTQAVHLKHILERRPLGRVSTGKKVSVPNFLFIRSKSLSPVCPLCSRGIEPVISSADSGSVPLQSQRGDPFSHPSGF